MVLPFLALAAGGVISAIGASQSASQARRADEADRRAEAAAQADLARRSIEASKVPLNEKLKQTTSYGQKITTTYGQNVTSTGSIDFSRMVADAEAAGFNPLSVLRAGGLSGYMTNVTQTSGEDVVAYSGQDVMTVDRTMTGHNAHLAAVTPLPSRGMTSSISPGGEFMQGIGGAISTVSQSVIDMAQSTMMAQANAMPSAGFGGAGGVGLMSPVFGGGPMPSGQLGLPSRDRWTEEVPSVTNPMGFDWWYSNPLWADVETAWEARLGDVGGAVAFPFVLGADIGHTLRRNVENVTGWDPGQIGDWVRGVFAAPAPTHTPPIPSITVQYDSALH